MAAENSLFYRQQENWWECHQSKEDNTSMSEDDGVLERFLEELDVKGHEMIEKLVENGVPFEQVFRETWHHFRGKHASLMLEEICRKMRGERDDGDLVRRDRGLDGDGDSLQGELKNERFKVKTVNVIVEEAGK